MFGTLLIKEIHEMIHTLRFQVAVALCLFLIPLGIYITILEYDHRLDDYHRSVQLYTDNAEGTISYNFSAEGYRPPAPLSLFAVGLEYFFPNKITTANNGKYSIINDAGIDNPLSLLFGKIDFQFIVTYVLSLMALMFMFSIISGEKEDGTLQMVIANPVKRGNIIFAKITGGYTVFLLPFIVALLTALLIMHMSGNINVFTLEILPRLLVLFLVMLLFLLIMFILGILVSSLTRRSSTSMIILLVLWVLMVLVIPKVSPVIASIIHPVKSRQVLMLEEKLTRETYEREHDTRLGEEFDRVLEKDGIADTRNFRPGDITAAAELEYEKEKKTLDAEYNTRIAESIQQIQNEYDADQNIQLAIARNLSRLSPVSCFTFIVTELAGTGLLEIENISKAAREFQNKVNEQVYNRFILQEYASSGGVGSFTLGSEDGFNPSAAPVPQMNEYRPVSFDAALGAVYPDIALLMLYGILFFVLAYVAFLRYDVR